MAIEFPCPACGRKIHAPASAAGKPGACMCGASVTVPAPEPAPTPAMVPQPPIPATAPAPAPDEVADYAGKCVRCDQPVYDDGPECAACRKPVVMAATVPVIAQPTPDRFEHRDAGTFVVLMVFTLGIYWLYLLYDWARVINTLRGREQYPPIVVLLVSLLTCSLGGVLFEVLFGYDLQQCTESINMPKRDPNLGQQVLVATIVSIALTVCTAGIGAIIGIVVGIWGSWLIQKEINRLARPSMP